MFATPNKSRFAFGAGIALMLVLGQPVRAEDVTEAQILKALSPPKTRGLSLGTPAQPVRQAPTPEESFIDSLRNKPTRALSLGERDRLDVVAANKPAIDLAMEFDFNSDVLRGDALATANKLGKVLANPEMKGQTFMIAGHTDAKGADALNQRLSEQRAEAVKRFLVEKYGIAPANLIAVGYGKAHLKKGADPYGKENRRVQAVNMMQQVKTAAR